MGGKTDREKVSEFTKKVRADYPDARVIFFGSIARGDALQESDFDLIVVSEAFVEKNFFKRSTKMYDYWNEKAPLEVFCYTPEEFNKKKNEIGIVKNAVETAATINA